jgi:hypothetical protein
MGRESESTEPVGVLFEERQCSCHDVLGVDTISNVDEFIKPPGANRRRRHLHHELRKRFDIKHGGCSPATQLGKAVEDRLQIIFIGECALEVVYPPNPM